MDFYIPLSNLSLKRKSNSSGNGWILILSLKCSSVAALAVSLTLGTTWKRHLKKELSSNPSNTFLNNNYLQLLFSIPIMRFKVFNKNICFKKSITEYKCIGMFKVIYCYYWSKCNCVCVLIFNNLIIHL